jgi:hypothetical protein
LASTESLTGVGEHLNGVGEPARDTTDGVESTPSEMPGAMESVSGAAPEVTVHHASAFAQGSELSPEEQAISGIAPSGDEEAKEFADEDAQNAALAEGRAIPPPR